MFALISDLHSNVEALTAVMKDIRNHGVDEIFCLGDIVNYGPEPNEVIQMLMDQSVKSIYGNHDYSVVDPIEGLKYIHHTKELLARYTLDVIKEPYLQYLASLPLFRKEYGCYFVHSSPPNQFMSHIRAMIEDFGIDHLLDGTGCDVCFVGHTHKEVIYSTSDKGFEIDILKDRITNRESHELFALNLHPKRKYIINVGSVGFHKGGDPYASYCLYDPNTRRIVFRRVLYDMERFIEKLKLLDLPLDVERFIAKYLPIDKLWAW